MLQDTDQLYRYDYMRGLSRSNWAWEALRRNPNFLEDASKRPANDISLKAIPELPGVKFLRPRYKQTLAKKWGLAFFPNPKHNSCSADVFWTDELYPRKLSVYVANSPRAAPNDLLECLLNKAEILHYTHLDGREQILLRAHHQTIQIRCEGLSLLSWSPRKMHLVYDGRDLSGARWNFFESKADAFLSAQTNNLRDWTRKSLARRNALIAFDCRAVGLSIFDTAAVLYGHKEADAAWASPSDALRQKTLRAIKRGRNLVCGGYRELLLGRN